MSSDTTMQDDTGTKAALRQNSASSSQCSSLAIESLIHPASKSLMQVGSGTTQHAEPKKELAETVRHGTSVFPFAAYIWEPQSSTARVPLHWHREIELVRFSGAEYEIAVDMHNVVIKDDAFLLLPGNIMHTFTLPANCQESAIVFDPSMLAFTSYDEVQSEILEPLMTSKIPLPPIITTEHPAFNRIDKLYRYCVRNGGTTNASQRLLIKAKLLEILAVYHEYGLLSRKEVHAHKTTTKQDKLKELLNYVDTHYAGPITIRDASLRLGVTDQYFCRYFRRVTGMSFTEYLNDLRLRRATKEIELTNRPISDIAFDHGFENAGYFFKNFKQKYGITPLRYRKKYLKENTAFTLSTFGNHGMLTPLDADHTSAEHKSDMNTHATKPADTTTENKKFTSLGLIETKESEREEEEYYLNSIVSPYINADDEVDAVTANRAAEAAAEATAQAIAKATAAAAAKGETLSDEALAAAANQGLSAASSATAPASSAVLSADASAAASASATASTTTTTATSSSASAATGASAPTGVSAATGASTDASTSTTAPTSTGVSAATGASTDASASTTVPVSPSASAATSSANATMSSSSEELNDDDVEYYEDEYEDYEDEEDQEDDDDDDENTSLSSESDSNNSNPTQPTYKVATTQEEIDEVIKAGLIKHLEASDSEDELFDDDEDDYIAPADNEIRKEIDEEQESNNAATPIKSPLQALADSHTRGSTLSSRKARGDKLNDKPGDDYNEQDDESVLDDETRKKTFVSALEVYQKERAYRNSLRSKFLAKNAAKLDLTDSTKSLDNNEAADHSDSTISTKFHYSSSTSAYSDISSASSPSGLGSSTESSNTGSSNATRSIATSSSSGSSSTTSLSTGSSSDTSSNAARSSATSSSTSSSNTARSSTSGSKHRHSTGKHRTARVTKSSHTSRHMIAPNDLPDEDRSLTGLSTFDSSIRQTRENPAARAIEQNQSKNLAANRPARKYALGSSFEDDEMESSSEILRRAMENKLKTDSNFAAEKQQKSDKPVNRAELRAKIAELEARNKNDDPFSI